MRPASFVLARFGAPLLDVNWKALRRDLILGKVLLLDGPDATEERSDGSSNPCETLKAEVGVGSRDFAEVEADDILQDYSGTAGLAGSSQVVTLPTYIELMRSLLR